MKKLVMLLLALVMIFSMTIVATAADTKLTYVVEGDTTRVVKVDKTPAADADTTPAVEVDETYIAEVYSRKLLSANGVATMSLGTDEYGHITFETFADLKELISTTTEYSEARYAGSAEEFVISENIEIPANLELYFWDVSVKIPEGVTCQTSSGFFSVDNLTVNGTLVNDGDININCALTVNGTLKNGARITLESDATVVGFDKITLTDEYASINKNCYPDTEAKVYEALAAAADDQRVLEYNIYIDASVTLNSDFTIPANAMLMTWGELTINGTCTVDGSLQTYQDPITVNGKLVNNGDVFLNEATLTMGSGASYSGAGEIICMGITAENALVGLNLDDFRIDNWENGCTLTYLGDLTRLGSPTDLTWGVQHGWAWDDEDNPYHDPSLDTAVPGMISFKRPALDQARYSIKLYRVGEEYPVASIGISYGSDPADQTMWADACFFINEINESGDYYFTVTALGDGINYADGPTVKSDVWTYVKPAKTLTTPTQLSWDWPDAVFNVTESEEEVYGCYVDFYHTDDLSVDPWVAGGSHISYFTDRAEAYDWMLQDSGNGYYSFEVMLISNDITKIANSGWSAMSPAYNLGELSGSVESELDKIVDSGAAPEEIRDAVQAIDTEELKSAMLADQENSGVVADIVELEEAVGGPAEVEVTAEAAAFDASKVSIVGANLNNAESESDPIKLVLDKPEKEHVLDTLYSSAVAVSFSMDLENVKDTENLDVPVKITLPVPSSINPQFLVILHYHADGSMEELMPYIYSEGGQFYAEFVLTSFSDFVLTQYANQFKDVPENAYYRDAVVWAVESGITTGTGDGTTFKPNESCTRGQVVTFLWRAAGKPEPAITENPFKDVKSGDYFYKAVLWALENKITTGTGDGSTFEPNANCNRAQIVTFLSRAKNGQPTSSNNPFKDVAENAYYYNPVLWAVENGITTGTGDGTTFEPNSDCTRGQVITFLWRAYTK